MDAEKLNQGLVVMLVAAIVVSIGSTLISLNKLSVIGGITGFATSDVGTVTFQVNESTSITLTDNSVDFGTCILNNSGFITYDSDITNGTSVQGFYCDGLSAGEDYMVLENDGNVNVSVTLQSDVDGPGFTGSPTSRGEFWFKAAEEEVGSCTGTLADSWVNISQSAFDYNVCDDFKNVDGNDALKIWYRIVLPDDVPAAGVKTAQITFSAVKV